MKEIIAKKYVKALILSMDENEFDEVLKALKTISSAFLLPKFKLILDLPNLEFKQKADFVISLLDSSSDLMKNFIMTLSRNKRLDCLPEIYREFSYQRSLKNNSFVGLISGDFDLSEDKKLELEENFSKKFSSNIKFTTLKNDLKGIKIEINDLGIEVNFSIDKLKAQMSEYILKAI